MSERMGPEHYGAERPESQAAKAERIVKEELGRRGWTESTLVERRKGEAEKVKLALRFEARDAGDGGLDRAAIEDGQRGQREHSAVSLAAGQGMAVHKTRS